MKAGGSSENLVLRTRLSVLWLCGEATALATIAFELLSGVKQGVAISAGYLLLLSIIALIPPMMAFLSQTLRNGANRWANVIIGIVVGAFATVVMLQELEVQPAIAVDPAAGIVFQAIIVFYAFKSNQKA